MTYVFFSTSRDALSLIAYRIFGKFFIPPPAVYVQLKSPAVRTTRVNLAAGQRGRWTNRSVVTAES